MVRGTTRIIFCPIHIALKLAQRYSHKSSDKQVYQERNGKIITETTLLSPHPSPILKPIAPSPLSPLPRRERGAQGERHSRRILSCPLMATIATPLSLEILSSL